MNPIAFDNTYAGLPPAFYSEQAPTPVQNPGIIAVNAPLASALGIDPLWLSSPEGIAMVAGNYLPPGAHPIATVYAGHQFGGFNPQLGDGRAVLLGEVNDTHGRHFDLQLKGAGPTAYSRGGDGRSPLGPVLREYVISEAMHKLGVPTTRALAAATTGELVYRDEALPGAVLARVASSHIRVGTFEFFAARKDTDALRTLADHVIARHYPQSLEAENPYVALLQQIIHAQAQLVARWQLLGFIHGVMNTDNMLVCGETVDYGPCAFMDAFNPTQVYSSIDHQGRYAYRNQPGIAHWNLSQLAQSLIPLLDADSENALAVAQAAINAFPEQFLDAHAQGMAAKLGLDALEGDDAALAEDLLDLMAEEKLDFTLTFRRLTELAFGTPEGDSVEALIPLPANFSSWLERWHARLAEQTQDAGERAERMRLSNPAFIPRNHLLEQVISKGSFEGDLQAFHELMEVLSNPFKYHLSLARFASPPLPREVVRQTFCGT